MRSARDRLEEVDIEGDDDNEGETIREVDTRVVEGVILIHLFDGPEWG